MPCRRRLLPLLAFALTVLAPGASAHASTAGKAVSVARSELAKGVREVPDGSNRGTRIRVYGGSTTPRYYPAPWCAYFVSWVAKQSGRPLGPSGQGFGYVPYIKAWATRTGRWKKTPRSGDLILFPQHVGMVESVAKNGTLTTIEGNSSNRVARRWRRWGEANGYVRWATGGKVGSVPAPAPKKTAPKKAGPLVARISVYPEGVHPVNEKVGFSANDSSGDIARYAWDLDGDGAFDDAKGDNAERSYATAGSYKVGLRVTGRNGRTSTARATVLVQDNQAPVAAFDLPSEARVGEKVTGDASASRDPDGKIAKYEWDLDGDGQWGEDDERHSITFRTPGVHVAGLRVTDDRGAVAEAVHTISVIARPPVAKAGAPSRVPVGRELTFDASRSQSPDGADLSYEWFVDGDGTADAAGPKATWRFGTPGGRDIRLAVTDSWGARSETTVHVDVVNEAPTAKIALPSRIVLNENATLDAAGSTDPDSRIASWAWDLDDDGRFETTGSRVTAKYDRGGGRRIRLRVTDEFGAVTTTQAWISVLERPVARLALVFASPLVSSPIAFTAATSSDPDGRVDRLDWDLDGDGRTDQTTWSTGARVWWTYATAGNRTVSVTVTDNDGLQSRTTLVVPVR